MTTQAPAPSPAPTPAPPEGGPPPESLLDPILARRQQRYERRRAVVVGLLTGCLLLLILALGNSERLIVFDSPSLVPRAKDALLISEERSLVFGRSAWTTIRAVPAEGAASGAVVSRRVGPPVAALPAPRRALTDGDQGLLLVGRTGVSILGPTLERQAFIGLPRPPLGEKREPVEKGKAGAAKRRPDGKPIEPLRVRELVACRQVGDALVVVGKTDTGLQLGRCDAVARTLDFSGKTATTETKGLRRLRLFVLGEQTWAVWLTVDGVSNESRIGWARRVGDELVEPKTRVMPGLLLDFDGVEADDGAVVLIVNRRDGRKPRLARLDFDASGPAAELRALDLPPGAFWRGPVLGVSATRRGEQIELLLARVGHIERVRGDAGALKWSPPEYLGGLGALGRVLFLALVALIVGGSLLVVLVGVPLFRGRPTHVDPPAPFRLSAQLPPAPLWLRVAAFVFDMMFVLPALLFTCHLIADTTDPYELGQMAAGAPLLAHLLFCGIYVAFDVVTHVAVGATPGKLLFGLRVVDVAGRPPAPNALALRTLARLVDTALLLGALPVLVTPLHQRFGDIWADTLVVCIEEEGEGEDEPLDDDELM